MRRAAVAPEQMLQMAPAQELLGRSQDFRGKSHPPAVEFVFAHTAVSLSFFFLGWSLQ